MNRTDAETQEAICSRFEAALLPCPPHLTVGIARNVREQIEPVHGLRVRPEADTAGWYIWAGEWSDDPDFFVPLHVEHLAAWCPRVIPYLQLPIGWRFMLAPGFEDVWFDTDLAGSEGIL